MASRTGGLPAQPESHRRPSGLNPVRESRYWPSCPLHLVEAPGRRPRHSFAADPAVVRPQPSVSAVCSDRYGGFAGQGRCNWCVKGGVLARHLAYQQRGIGMPFFTREQWRAFWEREYTILVRGATALLKNEEKARDVVHDAFASFTQSMGPGREIDSEEENFEAAVRAYLRRVVRNHMMNRWREEARQRVISEAVARRQETQGNLDPQQQLILLRQSLLRIAQQHLFPLERELLEFLLEQVDRKPDELWPLWAEKK